MTRTELPPLVELHLHLEGTLEPELIWSLAELNGIALPYADLDDLRSRYEFTDLQSFLDLYYANTAVLQTAADFAALTRAYLVRAQRAGIKHAEVFFDPQAHLMRGVPLVEVVDGIGGVLATSEADYGISTGLIACAMRGRPVEEALDVLEELLAMNAPIIGLGLDSTEIGNPPGDFAGVYDVARAAGLHVVAHVGEEGPPAYITEALDLLHIERIDHGVRCLEDPVLVERLAAEKIPLTVCPLSNVRLRVVDTIADHPLPAMLAAGLQVTLNSDDPSYFGGYLDDNVRAVIAAFDFSREQVALLAENGVQAAFLTPGRRAELSAGIAQWLAD